MSGVPPPFLSFQPLDLRRFHFSSLAPTSRKHVFFSGLSPRPLRVVRSNGERGFASKSFLKSDKVEREHPVRQRSPGREGRPRDCNHSRTAAHCEPRRPCMLSGGKAAPVPGPSQKFGRVPRQNRNPGLPVEFGGGDVGCPLRFPAVDPVVNQRGSRHPPPPPVVAEAHGGMGRGAADFPVM